MNLHGFNLNTKPEHIAYTGERIHSDSCKILFPGICLKFLLKSAIKIVPFYFNFTPKQNHTMQLIKFQKYSARVYDDDLCTIVQVVACQQVAVALDPQQENVQLTLELSTSL